MAASASRRSGFRRRRRRRRSRSSRTPRSSSAPRSSGRRDLRGCAAPSPSTLRRGFAAGIVRNYGSEMKRIATIGVYHADLDSFLAALRGPDVALVLDVRQRRGVRGREYAWANAQRLQSALADAGGAYEHRKELAPTTELRHLQYAEDDRLGVGKRSRRELAPAYVEGYRREILDHVDLRPIAEAMPAGRTTALLCVERDPEACHRSLVADELRATFGVEVVHLRP